MDNLTHTLCGLALARAGIDRTDRLATATLLIGANLPDLDVIGTLWGGDLWYLTDHRGLTHALLGLGVQTPLLALLMWGLSRRLPRRADAAPSRLAPLLLAAAAGLLSHLLLDGLNTYGVRPWLPFDGTWLYGDVLFIVDPWLWLLFGAAACLGGTRTRRESAYWVLFTLMATLVIASATRQLPLGVPLVWCLGVAAVAAARLRGAGLTRPRAAAALMLGLALLYLAGMRQASRAAHRRGVAAIASRLPAGEVIEATSSHPRPALPWRFLVLVQTRHEIHAETVDLRQAGTRPAFRLPRRLDDPWLAQARGTPEHRAWQIFARHPFVGRAGQTLILGDARYDPHPRESWCNIPLRISLCGRMR